jgi:hypothetical protein
LQRFIPSLRHSFRTPAFLLALAAALIAFAIQSGELGSSDPGHRLQVAHSWWTSEPQVFPNEYPDFGVHGRNGKLQAFYGIGQSLLMLPADIAGTLLERLPIFANYNGNDPSVRDIVVSYTVNILLSVLTALVCFRFLLQLKFTRKQAAAGVLALLLGTTHLHYTQVLQENNYLFLLTLAGFSWQYKWLITRSRRALLIGSAALGLNLLTRLTTGMDLFGVSLFILLALLFEGVRGRALFNRCRAYLAVALPVYLFFGLLDRLYQFNRFGTIFTTYMTLTAQEQRQRNPSLPLNFPFSAPFHQGFLGALFAPEKSIFLFDPLLILAALLAVVAWKRFSPQAKAYTLSAAFLLFAYIAFYARYFAWAGDYAWGDRYVSTPAELAALLAVPLLIRLRNQLPRFIQLPGVAITTAAIAIQAASVTFWLSLEEFQLETLRRPVFVVALRFQNILGFALGRPDPFGLANRLPTEDQWAWQHVTAWNFLPFQLQHSGEAPTWVMHLVFAVWIAGIIALVGTLVRLHNGLNNVSRGA